MIRASLRRGSFGGRCTPGHLVWRALQAAALSLGWCGGPLDVVQVSSYTGGSITYASIYDKIRSLARRAQAADKLTQIELRLALEEKSVVGSNLNVSHLLHRLSLNDTGGSRPNFVIDTNGPEGQISKVDRSVRQSSLTKQRTRVVAQPTFEVYEGDQASEDLGGVMRRNLAQCDGSEPPLIRFSDGAQQLHLYAQADLVNVWYFDARISEKLAQSYIYLSDPQNRIELAKDIDRFYLLLELDLREPLELENVTVWSLVRAHFYLSNAEHSGEGLSQRYITLSQNLLRRLNTVEDDEFKLRAIAQVISNVSAMDTKRTQREEVRKALPIEIETFRKAYGRVLGRLNESSERFERTPITIPESSIRFYKTENEIELYKTTHENDYIFAFHIQHSLRYFDDGMGGGEAIGLPNITELVSLRHIVAASLCSPNATRANVKLFHLRNPILKSGRDATSVTERFIYNYFDLHDEFLSLYWFKPETMGDN